MPPSTSTICQAGGARARDPLPALNRAAPVEPVPRLFDPPPGVREGCARVPTSGLGGELPDVVRATGAR